MNAYKNSRTEKEFKDNLYAAISNLEGSGLIRTEFTNSMYNFKPSWISITKDGIDIMTHQENVRWSRNYPKTSIQRFPPYQIHYNIGGDYIENDGVMGDMFKDIHNATIINKSLVENSFNKIQKRHDEETSKALLKVAEFIEKSKDPAAGALFNNFTEEFNKPQADKSRLKSFWSGIQNVLPLIASISKSVAKIVTLF